MEAQSQLQLAPEMLDQRTNKLLSWTMDSRRLYRQDVSFPDAIIVFRT